MPTPPRLHFGVCLIIILISLGLSAYFPEYTHGFMSIIVGVVIIYVADALLLRRK